MSTFALIGTGLIGSGFANAALARGDRVAVFNRTREKALPLAEAGARLCTKPHEVLDGATSVHLVLTDDSAVDDVLTKLIPHVKPGVVVVDHSTTSPFGARARAERCERANVAFVHAPIFMSPQAARDGKGMMLVSGPHPHYNAVAPELAKMTGDVWYLGVRPDLAAAYKLFGNAMLLVIAAGLADVFALARALDIEPVDAHALFSRFKPAGAIDVRGARMAKGDFATSFALDMARKDVGLMLDAGDSVRLALLPALAARMDELVAQGHGGLDVGVLAVDDSSTRATRRI